MAAESRLGRQLEEVAAVLTELGVRYALIGGLALAAHKVVRATQDVDLLVDSGHADEIDKALLKLGYHCVYRSSEAGNYQRGDERLDFLYASRPSARNLLSQASERTTGLGPLHVVSAEGLIAFKLQALSNNPRRAQDLEDIRALLRSNRDELDMAEVRRYFTLFGRENLLEELLHEGG
jgi:predicted nucleotidyltransferase